MTQKPEPVVYEANIPSKVKTFMHLYLPKLITGLVLIIVVIVAVVLIDNYRQNRPRTGICSNTLISQAAVNITDDNVNQLSNNVATIQGLSSYQHDLNCMYIVTLYDLDTSNLSQAQNSLKLFNKAAVGQKLNPALLSYASAASLSQYVDDFSKASHQIENNTHMLSTPAKGTGGKKP